MINESAEGLSSGGETEPPKRKRGRPPKEQTKIVDLPGMTGPGVAPVKLASVDKLISRYINARDERMELTKKEVEAKTKLIDELRANKAKIGEQPDGTIVYKHDDLVCTLKHGKDDLKVRTEEDESGNE
jgi:hypothetical protein